MALTRTRDTKKVTGFNSRFLKDESSYSCAHRKVVVVEMVQKARGGGFSLATKFSKEGCVFTAYLSHLGQKKQQ
jgi:hypothetical protein